MKSITQVLNRTPTEAQKILGVMFVITPDPPDEGENQYIELPGKGISMVVENKDRITTLQLYGKGFNANYENFSVEIYPGLKFSMSREAVRAVLGAPVKSEQGGAGKGCLVVI